MAKAWSEPKRVAKVLGFSDEQCNEITSVVISIEADTAPTVVATSILSTYMRDKIMHHLRVVEMDTDGNDGG